jgi:hypothetical protein
MEEGDPRFLHLVPYGAFVAFVSPFALLLALGLALSCGVIYPTRADHLWAVNSARQVDERARLLTDATVVMLHRSQCYGWCPEYDLTISGSGNVTYNGKAYVCEFGRRTARVDPREVSRLVEAMVATGYFGYSWSKGLFATDNPTVTTSLQHDGHAYQIAHYHGDTGAPDWLRAMEREIDRVAGTERWLPVRRDDGMRGCSAPDGSMRTPSDSPPSSP